MTRGRRLILQTVLTGLTLSLVLVLVLAWRTFQLPDAVLLPPDSTPDLSHRLSEVSVDQVAARLAEAIRFRTISIEPTESTVEADAAFSGLRDWLVATYPSFHRSAERKRFGRHGLLYRWPGRADCQPAGFVSHQDLVPVEAGTEANWTHPPFDGVVADGFVWGRGAVDTKDNLVLLMEAADGLAERGFQPHCDLYFIFGHDEEIGGRDGAARMAEFLRERGVRFAWLLDEGGGIGENLDGSTSPPMASVGVSSQGYLNLRLTARAPGGHSASGVEDTAIVRLARALLALQSPMPARLDGVAERDVRARAAGGPLPLRILAANLWLFGPLAEEQIEQRGGRGMLRTTLAATIIEGGVRANVLPQQASALVNARIHPRSSIEEVLNWVRERVDSDVIDVNIVEPADPPTRPVHPEDPAFQFVTASIGEVLGPVRLVPAFGFGGYDGRYFQDLSDALLNFEFTPIDTSGGQHGTDEKLDTRYLANGVLFYQRLMERHGEGGG